MELSLAGAQMAMKPSVTLAAASSVRRRASWGGLFVVSVAGFLTIPHPAAASEWVRVGGNQNGSLYYDPRSVQRDSTGASVNILADWPNAKPLPDGSGLFYSDAITQHFRCGAHISDYATEQWYYAGHIGNGPVLKHYNDRLDHMDKVSAGSLYETIYKVACGS